MSNVSNMYPTDDLIEIVPQIGVVNITTNFTDYVEQLPTPNLPTFGITDQNVLDEIQSFQNTAIKHLETAKNHASYFFSDVRPGVMSAYFDLLHFATGPELHVDYPVIYKNYGNPDKRNLVLKGLKTIQSNANRYLSDAKIALAEVSTYNQNLSSDQDSFRADYEAEKAAATDLSALVTQIEDKINALNAKIGENNKKVADTAIEEGLDLVKNGVALAVDAASENVGDAVKTGAVMAFNFIKADVTIIVMEVEIINMIREIAKLQQSLTLLEHDLMALNNLGSIFSSLSDSGNYSYDTLTTLCDYWEGLATYMQTLIDGIDNNGGVNLIDADLVSKTWDASINKSLSKILTIDYVNEAIVLFKEGKKMQFDSLDNISKYL